MSRKRRKPVGLDWSNLMTLAFQIDAALIAACSYTQTLEWSIMQHDHEAAQKAADAVQAYAKQVIKLLGGPGADTGEADVRSEQPATGEQDSERPE